MRLRQNLEANF